MTGAIRINHLTKEILISKSFSKAAMNPNSIEYQDLKEVMSNHPDYKISQRIIKKNAHKKTYSGLNYAYMRDYIVLHASSREEEIELLAEFEELILIARCHANSTSYPTIKNWFLTRYPEVAEFGTYEKEPKYQLAC